MPVCCLSIRCAYREGHVGCVYAVAERHREDGTDSDINNSYGYSDNTTLIDVVLHIETPPYMVEALILAKVDVDAKSGMGDTALSWAVWSGNLPAVMILIKTGADMFSRNRIGVGVVDGATSRPGNRNWDCVCYVTRRILMETLKAPVQGVHIRETLQMLPLPMAGGHIALYELIIDYVATEPDICDRYSPLSAPQGKEKN